MTIFNVGDKARIKPVEQVDPRFHNKEVTIAELNEDSTSAFIVLATGGGFTLSVEHLEPLSVEPAQAETFLNENNKPVLGQSYLMRCGYLARCDAYLEDDGSGYLYRFYIIGGLCDGDFTCLSINGLEDPAAGPSPYDIIGLWPENTLLGEQISTTLLIQDLQRVMQQAQSLSTQEINAICDWFKTRYTVQFNN